MTGNPPPAPAAAPPLPRIRRIRSARPASSPVRSRRPASARLRPADAAPAASSDFPRAFGGYRLLGLLGTGGMGTVYEAEHLATGRRVALKMLDQRLDSTEMRQRFLREGRLAARVNHPNSLYVFGSEEIEGAPVITMEISGAGTLEDRLQKRGPLPVTEAVDATLDVIAGLEAAAAGGVLHRDVKPANCFVGSDGSVRVGDYGLSVSTLAREDTLVTAAGVIMGTPAYAPPEQLRGDDLDLRADIYSVGATLFSLLTNRLPFEGKNAVEIVAKAVNEDPRPVSEFCEGAPPGLDAVVRRCLAKTPEGRYGDYASLRRALLPFSSREPEPATMLARAAAGWIDYLLAFLPPYAVLMFTVGAGKLLVQPLVERTLFSFRYYLLLFAVAGIYFTVAEGIFGAGFGKALKGLRVTRADGRTPGLGRAFVRFLVPILCVEGVRLPLTMTFISQAEWTGLQTALFVLTFVACGWIPALLALRARPENAFTTLWDSLSRTRVIVKPKGALRARLDADADADADAEPEAPLEEAPTIGPYRVVCEMADGAWIAAVDPVLRRPVWLLRRGASELPQARRDVGRPGRLRWLQGVKTDDATWWDAFEALPGQPLAQRASGEERVPWGVLRHWLHDLASELWAASRDGTVPQVLSLDHVWITADGRAVLLDASWPEVDRPAARIPVEDLTGQQRFLHAVAATGDKTSLPLHVRPMLQNLEAGRFEKLSFFTGTLRGILERPWQVGRGMRAGSLYLLPLFVWVAGYIGRYHDKPSSEALGGLAVVTAVVLFGTALANLLGLPFRSTVGQQIFRLAVVDGRGEPATRARLLARWAIVWLPLLVPMSLVAWLLRDSASLSLILALALLLGWLGATVYTVLHPSRGLHDRLADTWIVRR